MDMLDKEVELLKQSQRELNNLWHQMQNALHILCEVSEMYNEDMMLNENG